MFNRITKPFREIRDLINATISLCEKTTEILHDKTVPREYYNARVRDLLDANNREVERRRAAERECRRLERELLNKPLTRHVH